MSLPRLSERLAALRGRLDALGDGSDLSARPLPEIAEAAGTIERALHDLRDMVDEHAAFRPSGIWVAVAVVSGLGGLFLVDVTAFSLVVTAGGAVGAAKALFDLARHVTREQQILSVYWRVRRLKEALAGELARRGIDATKEPI